MKPYLFFAAFMALLGIAVCAVLVDQLSRAEKRMNSCIGLEAGKRGGE